VEIPETIPGTVGDYPRAIPEQRGDYPREIPKGCGDYSGISACKSFKRGDHMEKISDVSPVEIGSLPDARIHDRVQHVGQ
jgi:hypothetical protein